MVLSIEDTVMNPGKDFTLHVGFILMPEYTLSPLANAVSVMRMANRITGKNLYKYSMYSIDDAPVTSSAGVEIVHQGMLQSLKDLNVLFLCGGYNIERYCDKTVIDIMRGASKKKIPVGGICTGSYILAVAGLLDGYRCTIHWENMATMREKFPHLNISSRLFVIDRDRYTCSGGISSIDMMLQLVSGSYGNDLVHKISEQLTCDRVRTENDLQRAPLQYLVGASQPRLAEAVGLMENNIEEPLQLDEIAECVGISRRQLERLFNRYLQRSPSRYYLELRLYRARLLLIQSSIPLIDVAISCGFSTAPHFSKCYKDVYGKSPSHERRILP